MRWASYASVATAAIVIFIKLGAWLYTDSLSLLSSLVDSVLDITASLINLVVVHYAVRPADEDHRFGHGKAESIAVFAQGTFIGISAICIGIEAIHRLMHPIEIHHGMVGIMVMGMSMVGVIGLLAFQHYVIERTQSAAIKADSLHYQSDLLVNAVVIISLMIVYFSKLHIVDTIVAFGITAYILISAFRIMRLAFDQLMDKEFSEEDRQKILEAILAQKEVNGVHDLRTRHSGIRIFIQFHLELDGNITLEMAHKVSDQVEKRIQAIFPHAEILVHQDPSGKEKISLAKGRVLKI